MAVDSQGLGMGLDSGIKDYIAKGWLDVDSATQTAPSSRGSDSGLRSDDTMTVKKPHVVADKWDDLGERRDEPDPDRRCHHPKSRTPERSMSQCMMVRLPCANTRSRFVCSNLLLG